MVFDWQVVSSQNLLFAAVLVVGLLVTQQLSKGKEAHAEQATQ